MYKIVERSVCVCVGELCEGVRVGGVYNVIGVPVHSLREASSRAFVCSRLEVRPIHKELCVCESSGHPGRLTMCSTSRELRCVWLRQRLTSRPLSLISSQVLPPHPLPPPSLHEVFLTLTACSYSPWAFSATLAYSFAGEHHVPSHSHPLSLSLLDQLSWLLQGPTIV